MKKLITDVVLAGFVGLFVAVGVSAANSGNVNATVTAKNVALTVTSGTVSYGTIDLSGSASTVTLGASQTVTNTGNVNEDFTIKGYDTTGTGVAWTLAATIGADQYKHEFSTSATFPGTALTTGYQSMSTAVASLATKTLDLKIYTPSSTSDYNQKTAQVTVMASAS